MSVNKLSMARVAVGSLLVGSAPGKNNGPLTPSPTEVSGMRVTPGIAVNPGTVGIGAGSQVIITIPGARPGDVILPIAPANLDAGLAPVETIVTAANTVKVTVLNTSGASITATAKNWTFFWIQLFPNN